jgi:probable HAF family extracellular repeat protein
VANGINALGQIVGTYVGEDEVFHGFLRDPDDQ